MYLCDYRIYKYFSIKYWRASSVLILLMFYGVCATEHNEKEDVYQNRFSVALGVGREFGMAGGMLSYDFSKWGVDFSLGGIVFGGNITFSLRYNLINNRIIILSPTLSIFTHSRYISMVNRDEGCNPGIASGVVLRSYFGKHFFVNNTFGIEYTLEEYKQGNFSRAPWFHSGIGIGYTFRGFTTSKRVDLQLQEKTIILTLIGTLFHIALSIVPVTLYVWRFD